MYHCVCVRVCVRACARVSESACVRACVRKCERACVRACLRARTPPAVCVRVGVCACVCECRDGFARADPGPARADRARGPQPHAPSCARGRGGAAHRRARLVSAESDAGTVPLIALLYNHLRSPPPHDRRPGVPHRTRDPAG